LGGVGLRDNTSISLPSNNPQETFDQIVADLENPEIFPGYEPAGSDYPTTDGFENPRRIFFKNGQFVQLRSFKESVYDPGQVLFTTSHHNPPAGFTKADLIGKNNEERSREYILVQQKEHATVVNNFLRYCEKKDIRGNLQLNFPETLKSSELPF